MKGKIFLFLFALPFFGVGVWMGYSAGSNMADAWQMKQWVAVQGTLHRAGYETHSGDDSYTYEAYADYTYEYGGQQYSNDRVAIAGGADNIGDYQQDMGRHLSGIKSRGETVTVYVDSDEPSAAILDRSLRWGMVGFKSIFLFTFGGVGLGLIIFVFRAPKEKDLSAPQYRDSPWLANDKWQTAVIKSGSKTAMYASWAFAAFWNLISAPLPFVIYAEVTEKNNLPALLGLLFPLVGLGLITWAVKRTLEWNRFGAAPVTLDPYPGSIGGHVGGTIDVNLPYDASTQFSLTLTSLRSYMSGSGKNRSRQESAEWQDTKEANVVPGAKGSRLSFRFDVPENLEESDADQSEGSYYLWRLNIRADLPGVDIDRDYEIPVYATAEDSATGRRYRPGLRDTRVCDGRGLGSIVRSLDRPGTQQAEQVGPSGYRESRQAKLCGRRPGHAFSNGAQPAIWIHGGYLWHHIYRCRLVPDQIRRSPVHGRRLRPGGPADCGHCILPGAEFARGNAGRRRHPDDTPDSRHSRQTRANATCGFRQIQQKSLVKNTVGQSSCYPLQDLCGRQ